ncbi:MAG: hypothetical protein E4G90_12065 [Gemmatimonadales bacterium]|nr:MAG: hypothetical protein E4G90_12065 [Gemmatimonadales bacterium]
MYDEFERSVTGKSGERLSFLAWFSIGLGTLFVLGIVAAGLTAVRVRSHVAEIVHVIQREIEAHPTLAAEAMVERLESHASLLSIPPEEGVTLLQDLGSGSPSDAFMEEFFGGSLELFPEGQEFVEGIKDRARESIMEVKSHEGRVRMDLVRGEDGGSLVIESDDGQVRFDLKKTEDGGFLAIDSDDGQVRFDLIKGEDGGSLVINSDDGHLRFDVKGGDNGGTLVIRTDDATLHFGAGDEAEAMPGWIRRIDGMPADPQRVYSLSSEKGFMGAVAWEGDGSPQDVMSFYRDWLEGEGYDLRAEHRLREEGNDQGSLWARNKDTGQVVFLVAGLEDGMTKVLLGYGEGKG